MRTPDAPPVLVFDLDGTILRINSFPRWAGFLLTGPVSGLGIAARARLSFDVATLLALRKLRRTTHDAFQGGLSAAWRAAWRRSLSDSAQQNGAGDGASAIIAFQARLRRHVRPCLRPLLALVAAGRFDAVMATAASAEYAVGLGLELGFRHVLATPGQRESGEPPNSGERKCDRVRTLLEANGWQDRRVVLFTDHIDDLPLMRDSDLVCWFGPYRRLAEARRAAHPVVIVPCRDLSPDRILGIVLSTLPAPPRGVQAAAAWWSLMAAS